MKDREPQGGSRVAREQKKPLPLSREQSGKEQDASKKRVPLSSEAVLYEQTKQPVVNPTQEVPKTEPPVFDYFEANKELKSRNANLIKKNKRLLEENNELWNENSQLRESLKEHQELREKEEKRKKQAKDSQQRWRENNPEVMKRQRRESRERHKDSYNEYQKEYMKRYRSRKKS